MVNTEFNTKHDPIVLAKIKSRKTFNNDLPWKVKREAPKMAYKRNEKHKFSFYSEE